MGAISPRVRRGLSPRGRASRLPRKSRTRGRAGGKTAWRRVASRTKTRLRRFAIRVVEHEDFEALVVCAIFCNCVSLALYRPLEEPSSRWNETLDTLELSLNVFFTVELALRCGVAGAKKYARDPCCLLYTSPSPRD